jgi:hypothetical protein
MPERKLSRIHSDEQPYHQIVMKNRPVCDLSIHTILANIRRLFSNREHSDATIRIDEKTLPVDKTIMCRQSGYFQKAFRAGFAEGNIRVLKFNEGSDAAY